MCFSDITQNNSEYSRLTTDQTNLSDDGHGADDNESEASNQPGSHHPAHIVLDRPGYFTIPSMQELASLVDSKGKHKVGSHEKGNVKSYFDSFQFISIRFFEVLKHAVFKMNRNEWI